jgi:hypothetical protein
MEFDIRIQALLEEARAIRISTAFFVASVINDIDRR